MRYEILPDHDASNPRTEFDNLGTIAYKHRRFVLGDETINDVDSWLKEKMGANVVILPVYAYEHGNICLNTAGFSCPWDSYQVGFIYCDLETIRLEYGVRRVNKALRAKVEAVLRIEVETFSQYLSGDVWEVRILDDKDDVIDACCGYFGRDYAEQCAEESLQWWKTSPLEVPS